MLGGIRTPLQESAFPRRTAKSGWKSKVERTFIF